MSAYAGRETGLAHREHPLLGRLVRDTAHEDRIGVLRAVAPDADPAPKYRFMSAPATTDERSKLDRAEVVAWIAPEGGGIEWPTELESIEPA